MTTAPLSRGQRIDKYAADRSVSWNEAAEAIAEQESRAVELAETNDPATLLPAIRDAISLRAKIDRIVKTVSNPPHYRIETDAGTVPLGPSSRWATRPAEFAAAFLDNLGEMPAVPGGEGRRDLFGMIARAAELENIGEEATDAGWMRAMLRHYLDQRPPVDTIDEAAGSEYPFMDDGRIVIFGPAFRRWLLMTHQERLSPADLGRRLRGIGGEPPETPHKIVKTGKRTTASTWFLPTDLG